MQSHTNKISQLLFKDKRQILLTKDEHEHFFINRRMINKWNSNILNLLILRERHNKYVIHVFDYHTNYVENISLICLSFSKKILIVDL